LSDSMRYTFKAVNSSLSKADLLTLVNELSLGLSYMLYNAC